MNVLPSGDRYGVLGGALVLCAGIVAAAVACSSSGPVAPAASTKPAGPATTPSAPPPAAAAAAPASGPAATQGSAGASGPESASKAALGASAAPSVCTDKKFCYETAEFAGTVTNFRTSIVSYYRIIDATVGFQNKTDKPLILGYAMGSGMAIDEKGNRYAVGGANGYRGIGFVNGQNFDPKFVVQPGGSAEAKFELSWAPGNAIVGSTFELDLTVNKINTVEGNQHTLGGEFPMTFRGLTNELVPPAAK